MHFILGFKVIYFNDHGQSTQAYIDKTDETLSWLMAIRTLIRYDIPQWDEFHKSCYLFMPTDYKPNLHVPC
jgi:hypothetical protein